MKTERFEELKKDTNTPFEERSSINLINQVASNELEHLILMEIRNRIKKEIIEEVQRSLKSAEFFINQL